MKSKRDGGRLALAVLFVALAPLGLAAAQSASSQDKEEAFDKVDPYTKGESAALEKLGYVQFGPLVFFDKVRTESIEEALGGVPILWVETAHFRIGSNLRTYKQTGDTKEDRLLDEELKRLKSRLPSTVRLPKNKLDPWLRLHLAAQRLEDQYADFEQRFGFTDADFPKSSGGSEAGTFMGEGPYLGMEQKFVVLMTEKQSATVRFLKQFLETESPNWQRWHTRGGATILAISAESLKTFNYDREIDLHATVAAETALNFVEAFRKGGTNIPLWFRAGLAHYYSRAVDERCTVSAVGTSRDRDAPDAYRWEPRVYGLVFNKAAKAWKDMAQWSSWDDLKAQGHLLAWSRVSWMLGRKDTNLHAFLMGITDDLRQVAQADRAKVIAERQTAAFQTAFGKPIDEVDAEWKQFVLRSYPKK